MIGEGGSAEFDHFVMWVGRWVAGEWEASRHGRRMKVGETETAAKGSGDGGDMEAREGYLYWVSGNFLGKISKFSRKVKLGKKMRFEWIMMA